MRLDWNHQPHDEEAQLAEDEDDELLQAAAGAAPKHNWHLESSGNSSTDVCRLNVHAPNLRPHAVRHVQGDVPKSVRWVSWIL